jgi:hypothetical protein
VRDNSNCGKKAHLPASGRANKRWTLKKRDEEMAFQNAKREMKVIYGHSENESSDNEWRETLHVMFGGSWCITSRCIIKTLRREVATDAPPPKTAPHRKWMVTSIIFDASNCPKSMAGARQLSLIISPTIANIKLYHVLIDSGAALNLISLTAFKKRKIPMLKLQPSRPFSGVGLVSVMLHGCISLPVTFGTPDNFYMKSVLFDVVEVNLPFNTILGRPTLYQFMLVAHYGYLVLKTLASNGVLKICRDHGVGVSALEKLRALATSREATAGSGDQDPTPSSSRQRCSTSAPCVQPSDKEGVPMRTIQIRTDAAQIIRITGI